MMMIANSDTNPDEVKDEKQALERLAKNGPIFLKAAQNLKFKILTQAAIDLKSTGNQ